MNGQDMAIIQKGLEIGMIITFSAEQVTVTNKSGDVEFQKEGRFSEQVWAVTDYIDHVMRIERTSFN